MAGITDKKEEAKEGVMDEAIKRSSVVAAANIRNSYGQDVKKFAEDLQSFST